MPLVLALVLAAVAIGIAAWLLFPARTEPDEDEDSREQRLALERDTAASQHFRAALDACHGLPTRLNRIAEAAEAKADALRAAQDAGLAPVTPASIPSDGRHGSYDATAHDSPSSPGSGWIEPSISSRPQSTNHTGISAAEPTRTTRSEKPPA